MKKRNATYVFLVLMVTAMITASCPVITFAASNVRETDVSTAKSGCTLLLYKGEFKLVSKATILSKINSYRKQACDKGYPDPRNTSRKLTSSDYVPIKWSSDLEWLAQTRAAEASMNMTHDRPNGGRYNTLTHNDICSQAEVLAWNNQTDFIMHGIEQWYGERSNWVNQKSGTVTGHYKQMINPANTYIGIGGCKPSTGYSTVAGEFSKSSGLDESQAGVSGTYYQKVEIANNNLVITKNVPSLVHVNRETAASFAYKAQFVDDGRTITSSVSLANPIVWSSSDEEIAAVSSAGRIKGISEGDVTLTAKIDNNTYTFKVQVREHIWNSSYTTDTPATGSMDGVRSIHCSVCGIQKPGSETAIPKFQMPKTSISKLTKGKKSFTVKWKKKSNITGYKIQYSTSKSFKNAKTITVKKASTVKKTKKSLKAKKKYYVRIRTYKVLYGHTYYSKWSKYKTVKTN